VVTLDVPEPFELVEPEVPELEVLEPELLEVELLEVSVAPELLPEVELVAAAV
jgi:hypothetical protein